MTYLHSHRLYKPVYRLSAVRSVHTAAVSRIAIERATEHDTDPERCRIPTHLRDRASRSRKLSGSILRRSRPPLSLTRIRSSARSRMTSQGMCRATRQRGRSIWTPRTSSENAPRWTPSVGCAPLVLDIPGAGGAAGSPLHRSGGVNGAAGTSPGCAGVGTCGTAHAQRLGCAGRCGNGARQ